MTRESNDSMTERRVTRRDFLCTAAKAAAFSIVPARVFGRNAPSNRITVGCIGTGNQGMQDMRGFLGNDDVQVVAVCDVNRASYGYKTADQFLGREPGRKAVNEFYGEKTGNDCANSMLSRPMRSPWSV